MFDGHTLIFVASKIEISYKVKNAAGIGHASAASLILLYMVFMVPDSLAVFRSDMLSGAIRFLV